MRGLSGLKTVEPADVGSTVPGRRVMHGKADVRTYGMGGHAENCCACAHCSSVYLRVTVYLLLKIYFLRENHDDRLLYAEHLFSRDHLVYVDHL